MKFWIRYVLIIALFLMVGGLLLVSYESFNTDGVNYSLVLENSDIKLRNNSTYQVNYRIYPVNTKHDAVKFYSMDDRILTVNETTGFINTKKVGTTSVKVVMGNVTEYCNINVVNSINSLSFVSSDYNIDLGDEIKLDTYRANSNTTYTSSNPMVALVSNTGVVTPVSSGSTVITMSNGSSNSNTLINVSDVVSKTEVKETLIDKIINFFSTKTINKSVSYFVGDTVDLNLLLEKEITIDNNSIIDVDGDCISYSNNYLYILKPGTGKINVDNGNKKLVLKVTCLSKPEVNTDDSDVDLEGSISSIKINGYNKYNYYVGESVNLSVSVTPINATSNCEWVSSNTGIATVSGGKVHFVGTGSVTIRAISKEKGSVSDYVTFIVSNKEATTVPVSSINIKGPNKLKVNDYYVYTADISPSNATDKNVTWTVSDSSIASINSNGKLTGNRAGTVTLTATCGGKTKSINIVIETDTRDPGQTPINVPATKVSITGPTSVYINESISLNVVLTPSNATSSIEWSSSNNNVATVDKGKVTGKSEGTAVITVKAGSVNASYSVKVNKKDTSVALNSISLSSATLNLTVGNTSTLTVSYNPSNATNKSVTWNSSDNSVATVNSNGVVTAVKAGIATITVTSSNNKSSTCRVTVTAPTPTPTPQPQPPTPQPQPQPPAPQTPCDVAKSKGYVDYKDFESSKHDNDDFFVAKAAHECANSNNLPVNVTKGTYTFYNAKNESPIIVKTDTNLNESVLIFNDSKLMKYKEKLGVDVDDILPFYSIPGTERTDLENKLVNTTYSNSNSYSSVLAGGNYFVKLENTNLREYHRKHGDDTQTSSYREYLVYLNGSRTANLIHDGITPNKAEVYEIPSSRLTFKNAKIRQYCYTGKETYSDYFGRGINVTRSNTTIDNVDFKYTNEDGSVEFPKLYYAYQFMNISKTYNTTYSNSKVSAYKSFSKSTGNIVSSYGLSTSGNVNLTYDGLKMYNEDMMTSKQTHWGITGTSYNNNWVVKNSKLNRVDAHKGVHGLTIDNSTLGAWGVHVVGDGNLNITNTHFKYSDHIVSLRTDYGGWWNGTITVKDCEWDPTGTIAIVNTGLNNNFDFGYDIILPDVNINKLKINSGVTSLPIYSITESTYKSFKDQYKNVPNYPRTAPGKRSAKHLATENSSIKKVTNSSGASVNVRLWK